MKFYAFSPYERHFIDSDYVSLSFGAFLKFWRNPEIQDGRTISPSSVIVIAFYTCEVGLIVILASPLKASIIYIMSLAILDRIDSNCW